MLSRGHAVLLTGRVPAGRICVLRSLATKTTEKTPTTQKDESEFHPEDYKPGSSTYAYDNPWPKLNKGRFDWLFGDGWRRPLAQDQGAWKRREWIPFGFNRENEHRDWIDQHSWLFVSATVLIIFVPFWIAAIKPEWPDARSWARREAYFELERRERAGRFEERVDTKN